MSYTLAYTGAEIDALLGKIDAIFVAEYGSTIYSEVTAAIAAGNKVIVANAGKVFVYAGTDDNGGYVFTQSGPNASKPNATYVTLSTGNVWSTNSVDLATLQQFYASLMEDTASGSIASFPDGAENVPVKELTADIEPIQDLHGQASPYPENGGKNKLPLILAGMKTANTTGTWSGNAYTLNGVTFIVQTDNAGNIIGVTANGTASALTVFVLNADINTLPSGDYILNGCPSGGSTSTYFQQIIKSPSPSLSDTGSGVSFTAGGSYTLYGCRIVVENGASVSNKVFYPMIRLSTEADATFAPYSNKCPITGYTGAQIPRTGKQLFDKTATDPAKGYHNGSYLYADGTFGNYAGFAASEYIKVKPSTSYTISGISGNDPSICFYDKDRNFLSGSNYANASAKTVTSPATAVYCRVSIILALVDSLQLEEGTTASPYEAFGTVYSVSWSDHGTVYKGLMKYKGGGEWEITATHKGVTIDHDDDPYLVNWRPKTNSVGFLLNASFSWDAAQVGGGVVADLLSNYEVARAYDRVYYDDIIGVAIQDGTIPRLVVRIPDTSVDSTARLNTYLTAHPLQVVYPLASPTSFTVTGPDPETLLGDNNMWSNTGDISVKYRANTALYIEKKLGE